MMMTACILMNVAFAEWVSWRYAEWRIENNPVSQKKYLLPRLYIQISKTLFSYFTLALLQLKMLLIYQQYDLFG